MVSPARASFMHIDVLLLRAAIAGAVWRTVVDVCGAVALLSRPGNLLLNCRLHSLNELEVGQSGTASVLLWLCLSSPLPLPSPTSPTSPHLPFFPPPVAPFASPPESQLYGTNLSEVDGCQWRSNAQAPSPVWLPYHSLWLI